jgi:hypothetical protein
MIQVLQKRHYLVMLVVQQKHRLIFLETKKSLRQLILLLRRFHLVRLCLLVMFLEDKYKRML